MFKELKEDLETVKKMMHEKTGNNIKVENQKRNSKILELESTITEFFSIQYSTNTDCT